MLQDSLWSATCCNSSLLTSQCIPEQCGKASWDSHCPVGKKAFSSGEKVFHTFSGSWASWQVFRTTALTTVVSLLHCHRQGGSFHWVRQQKTKILLRNLINAPFPTLHHCLLQLVSKSCKSEAVSSSPVQHLAFLSKHRGYTQSLQCPVTVWRTVTRLNPSWQAAPLIVEHI